VVGAGVDDAALAVLGTGLLGGFTTYSTWMVESALAGRRQGVLNVGLQFLAGAVAVAAGLVLGGLLGTGRS
ncbi:MAG: CrcB family protein, partial [Nitriliruptorales bacterium]